MEKIHRKISNSPPALHVRRPIEFQESPRQKTPAGQIPNDLLFKDNKFKDKLLGYVHKNRENKERIKSMANKVNNQLKLHGDSEDSQDSEVEGYNERLSKFC